MFGTQMQQEQDVLHSWLCMVTLCANRGLQVGKLCHWNWTGTGQCLVKLEF